MASAGTEAEDLLCVVRPAQNGSYIRCTLSEDPENKESPFSIHFSSLEASPEDGQFVLSELPRHLSPADDVSVDVIVSTRSGTGQSHHFWEAVLEPLLAKISEQLGVSGNISNAVITQDAHSVANFARDLAAKTTPRKTVILLSGDGGIVDIINNYHSSSQSSSAQLPLLALLPFGTGNAVFHSSHKPLATKSQAVQALRTLLFGAPVELPTFTASFSPGSVRTSFTSETPDTPIDSLSGTIVASYGFHASILYESDTPEYRAHGAKRFGMVAENLLKESHPYLAKVEYRSPGSSEWTEVPRGEHAYVLVAMVSNLERTFTISPASQPLDGKLRLIHFGAVGGERTMDVMLKAYDDGKHVGMAWDDGQKVGYEEIDEIRVTTLEHDARWRKVCIDGTIVELPPNGHMSVKRDASPRFNVLVSGR